MRRKLAWNLGWTTACIGFAVAHPAFASGPARPQSTEQRTAEEGVPPAPAPAAADPAGLTCSEQRVVNWLVDQIHRLDGSKDLLVDFSAEDVRRATGVDVRSIDPDHVRAAVRVALVEDCPAKSHPPAPASPRSATGTSGASTPTQAADPESPGGGPGF